MAVARVVEFEGVSKERLEEQNRKMVSGPPEGFPNGELVVLHDGADKTLVIFIFENDEDYAKADEMLNAMPTDDTPGRRVSVTKYDVAARM
jgi:hypothetical protein